MKSGISFSELAKLQMEQLSKQSPVTLEEARAQVLWLHSTSSAGINDSEIKRHLEIYFPDWTKEQIEDGINEIRIIILRESEIENVKQAIANYLTLHS